MKTLKLAAMAGALILGGMAGAHATPSYNVQVWIGAPNGTDSSTIADAAHQPTGPANASFTYNGPIDWKTTDSANLIAGFLNTASISGFSSPTYATLTDFGAASLSASHDPYASYFKITGIYSAPGDFAGSVSHDDGASLYVDVGGTTQTEFAYPAETSDKENVFTLPAGTHSFELDYVEGNGSPSILKVTFPDTTSVPEPMTLALLASGLIGLGVARRKTS